MDYETDHARFRDDIGAYLAGGLTDAERRAFEAHAAGCPDCAAALAGARAEEQSLQALFEHARPTDGLEDRIVGRLRAQTKSKWNPVLFRTYLHPAVRRAAVGVAAAVMLGGFGYIATQAAEKGGLPTPWVTSTSRVKAASNLRSIGQGIQMYANENGGAFSRQLAQLGGENIAVDYAERGETPSEMAKRFNTEMFATTWGRSTGAGTANEPGTSTSGGDPGMAGAPAAQQPFEGRVEQRNQQQFRTAARRPLGNALAVPGPAAAGDGTVNGRVEARAGREVAGKDTALGVNRAGAGGAEPGLQPNVGTSIAGGFGGGGAAGGAGFGGHTYYYGAAAGAPGAGTGAGGKAGGAIDARGFGLSTGVTGAAPAGPADEALMKKVAEAPAAGAESKLSLAYGAFKPADKETWEAKAPDKSPDFSLQGVTTFGDQLAPGQPAQAGQQPSGGSGGPQAGMIVLGSEAGQKAKPADAAKPAEAGKPADATKSADAVEKDAKPASQETLTEEQNTDADAPAVAQAPATGQTTAPAPAPATAPAPAPQPAPAANSATAGRKIIRNGEMSFEVDSFDSSYLQITKIASEEGGFVATTDSEKLANGKVRGVVTVRVPPDRLDTLVLKLRGLGELKSSKIAAQDITKQYTDLESQLKAARAMEERLLNLIKTGKGEIKELVEAEKQLGTYREKIEHIEGEVRYYANLISLSTLNVTLTERDIRTAAMLSETEQVNMGVEAEDVEKARSATIKAIVEAKGRIVESDLKKLEAGQFAGRVVADVPPDAAGPLIDRLRQVGTVARLEINRKQSAPEGTVAPQQGAALPRVERRDTRFLISLYNLANVAPRQTTTLNLAAEDVEVAYRAILDQVKSAGGRVVTSQLNRPKPDQTTGTITFEVPSDQADVLLGAVRSNGEVMRLEALQNPDTQNVTSTKRGFAVQIFSTAAVAPRETTALRLAARGVADAFNKLREVVRTTKGGRVLTSQLAEKDAANVTGTLDFEVRRDDIATIEAALRAAGQTVSRSVSRSSDAENTVDTKVRLQVTLVDEASLAPRETVTAQLAVPDVAGRYAALLEALAAAQARVLQSQLSEQESRKNVTATLSFDVRRENRAAVDKAIADAGDTVSRSVTRSTDTQNTLDDKVRLNLTLTDADKLPPRETTTLGLETRDVEKAKEAIESLARGMGGRVVDSTLSRETSGRVIGKVIADVPLAKAMEMVTKTRDQGRVLFRRDARDENVPAGALSRYRVDVTLGNEDLIVESGQGLGSRIREGLRTSAAGLLWSVQLIVVGLFLVAPWLLIVWFLWRLARRARTKRTGATTVSGPVPA